MIFENQTKKPKLKKERKLRLYRLHSLFPVEHNSRNSDQSQFGGRDRR